jgi:hypothetical protein
MKITGEFQVPASRSIVYERLNASNLVRMLKGEVPEVGLCNPDGLDRFRARKAVSAR